MTRVVSVSVGQVLRWIVTLALFPSAGLAAQSSQSVRERLTERDDENRIEEPHVVSVFGRELLLTGQYELTLESLEAVVGRTDEDRFLLEHEVELEVFFDAGGGWSFFAQARMGMREDLLGDTPTRVSDSFLERGEMWVIRENLFLKGLHLEAGRLEFADDRGWWWDDELDAIRLTLERDPFEIQLAIAHELGASEVDNRKIDPDEDGHVRFLLEASLDWRDEQSLEFYLLADSDRSGRRRLGEGTRTARADEFDASLLWFGPRLIGAIDFEGAGSVGYWLDSAWVRGYERSIDFRTTATGGAGVVGVKRRDVAGFGFDAGFTWFLPRQHEPRVTLGWAMGSGTSDRGKDRAFRQTGIQANEMGFGGAQQFALYGRLLDPELSNLRILTAGVGVTLFESSSLDLVYHHYRLVHRRESLRSAALDTRFSGSSRHVGQGLDLILALEEGGRVAWELSASAFRSGGAFGRQRDRIALGGFLGVRIAF